MDDRQENLDLLRSILEPLDYRVSTAGGVQEALKALRASPTDVHMGDGTGFDLVGAINDDPGLRGLPFIVTSATYLEADPRAEALGLNETNFLLAPIEPPTLVERINARLREGMKSRGASEVTSG